MSSSCAVTPGESWISALVLSLGLGGSQGLEGLPLPFAGTLNTLSQYCLESDPFLPLPQGPGRKLAQKSPAYGLASPSWMSRPQPEGGRSSGSGLLPPDPALGPQLSSPRGRWLSWVGAAGPFPFSCICAPRPVRCVCVCGLSLFSGSWSAPSWNKGGLQGMMT